MESQYTETWEIKGHLTLFKKYTTRAIKRDKQMVYNPSNTRHFINEFTVPISFWIYAWKVFVYLVAKFIFKTVAQYKRPKMYASKMLNEQNYMSLSRR